LEKRLSGMRIALYFPCPARWTFGEATPTPATPRYAQSLMHVRNRHGLYLSG
jgi:hypothetical protein